MTATVEASIDDALYALAERMALRNADFRTLMTRTQRMAYRKLRSRRHRLFYLDCSRRWGKTWFLVFLAIEMAVKKPCAIVRYCAPTKHHGRTFVIPAMRAICAMLPPHMRPKYNVQDTCWTWGNGSVMHLGSCESVADCDAQVGTSCDLAIFDEWAKIRHEIAEYQHKTVIVPQFATTAGTIVVGSTPPLSPAHYLTRVLLKRAMERDSYVRFVLDDCDHITPEMREELIDECGGLKSPTARRELFCEHIPDRDHLVIPEWLDVREECVAEPEAAEFRDWYASGDFGFEDLSVVLYAWFDFIKQRIVVEHEVVAHRESSLVIGQECKALEKSESIVPLMRVADAPLQLMADMAHPTLGPGIQFTPVQKDDADAALAHLRNEVGRKRILVHPRCRVLISHLEGAIWNTRRTSFERVGGEFGHWDAIDALKYLNRSVQRRRNPAPVIPAGVRRDTHFISPDLAKRAEQRQRSVLGTGGRR